MNPKFKDVRLLQDLGMVKSDYYPIMIYDKDGKWSCNNRKQKWQVEEIMKTFETTKRHSSYVSRLEGFYSYSVFMLRAYKFAGSVGAEFW